MNKRTYIGIGLVFIIAIMAVYLVLNWQTAFSRNIKITYPDGCVELYKNDNMTTPECTKGRLMQYQQELQRNNTRYGYGQWVTPTVEINNTVPPVIVPNVTETPVVIIPNTTVEVIPNTTVEINTTINTTNKTVYSYRDRMNNLTWNNKTNSTTS